LGHFCSPISLQVSAMLVIKSLRRVGIETSCRDVPIPLKRSHLDRSDYLGFEVFDTTLIHVQPRADSDPPYNLDVPFRWAGLHPRRDVYRIAMWSWELMRVPEGWRRAAESIDEVWAPSRFIADALRGIIEHPIRVLTPGVQVGEITPFDRARLGIPRD